MIKLMLTEPCRGRATAVSCRAASRTSRSACPCPVLPCILHIGGANWKSCATCDSPVLPRSPKDDPTPSRQLTCRICPDNSYRLQAEAIRACNLAQIAASTMVAHAPGHRRRRFRRMPAAASGTRASRMHRIGSVRLAGSPAVASRPAEAARCLESHASTRTRVYDPNMPDVANTYCAHSRPMPIRDRYQLAVAWLRLVQAESLAPMRLMDWRGRMRRIGATCTAAKTHARLQGMLA